MLEFEERYKKITNSELLEILSNPKNYKPLAIETAKKELLYRNLSSEDLSSAKLENKYKQLDKKKLNEQKKLKVDKLNQTIYSFFDVINPLENGIETSEKIIRLFSLVFGGISIYKIYNEFGLLLFFFTEPDLNIDLGVIVYFLPIIILPIAVILFSKRKKTGWILLVAFLTYSTIIPAVLFFLDLGHKSSQGPALDSVFPVMSNIDYLIALLLFGSVLWTLNKKNIRKVFQVTKKTMIQTVAITTTITVIHMFL